MQTPVWTMVARPGLGVSDYQRMAFWGMFPPDLIFLFTVTINKSYTGCHRPFRLKYYWPLNYFSVITCIKPDPFYCNCMIFKHVKKIFLKLVLWFPGGRVGQLPEIGKLQFFLTRCWSVAGQSEYMFTRVIDFNTKHKPKIIRRDLYYFKRKKNPIPVFSETVSPCSPG